MGDAATYDRRKAIELKAAGGKPGASAEDREKARQRKAIIESEPDLQLVHKLHRETDPQLRT